MYQTQSESLTITGYGMSSSVKQPASPTDEAVTSPLEHATLARHTLPLPTTLKRTGVRASTQPATEPLTDATLKSKFALNPKSIVLSDM